jgi:hypothetical protein
MAETPGTLYQQAGVDANTRYDLFSVRTEQANQVRGATGTYIDGKGRPSPITGAPVMSTLREFKWNGNRVLAHRCEGELLYIAIDADAASAIVSASYTYEIHEVQVNMATGARYTPVYQVAGRVTDTTVGGLADNAAKLVPGQKIPTIAVAPRLPPNLFATVVDFFKVVSA